MLEVVSVSPLGPAGRAGVLPGDRITAVNNIAVGDILDFLFLSDKESFTLMVKGVSGVLRRARIKRRPGESLGLEFAPFHIRRCRNHCIFCFVDQMPPGLRPSLYIKDDDYRASFLYGNYITLSNLSSRDKERIFRQRLSPLYISVHATDPELRSFMLGNPNAPDIIEELRALAAGGIRMHTQIVLCPGINDGQHLEKTVMDLAALYPSVLTVAVVPVGLTSHRKGCFPLKAFTRRQAAAVIDRIEKFGEEYKRRLGTRLVFCSDEFYIKAGRQIPRARFYEDFMQIENGVGMTALFLRKTERVRIPESVDPISITMITGVSFFPILRGALQRLSKVKGLKYRLIQVKNYFFGPSVTVAGLLTGSDIICSLKGKRLGDILLIPRNALVEGGDLLLDGMSITELEERLSVRITAIDSFREIVRVIRGM